jgi:hypothetical protein
LNDTNRHLNDTNGHLNDTNGNERGMRDDTTVPFQLNTDRVRPLGYKKLVG